MTGTIDIRSLFPKCTPGGGAEEQGADGAAARSPSAAEPDRAAVAAAVAEAADWRRLVVRHREYAVRAGHQTYRRSVWP